MKVGRSKLKRGGNGTSAPAQQRKIEVQHAPFLDLLQAADSEQLRRSVEADFESVDEAAKALTHSPTMDNLRLYKEAIKGFLSKVLDTAYEAEEMRGFNRKGKRTVSVLIRTVDEKLDELARLVLTKSRDALAIAARIDDIRGLILDFLR